MKLILKSIITTLGFVTLLSSASFAQVNWAPIVMGDITTFAPYAKTNTLQTLKNVYKPNDLVSVKVDAALSGDKDWVGVYHKNASSAWANVVAWNWVPHNGTFALSDIKKSMPVGAYEARLFFHNKYEKKASYPFTVAVSNFQTTKTTYAPNETVSVTVNVPLSGDKDWVGIFPKNADNSWGNVVAWNWITGHGTFTLTKDKKPMPAGEYEARLFWHNAYGAGVEAKQTFGFSVGGNNAYVYGSEGQYLDKVKVDNSHEKYVVYYPENHVQNAPLVLFIGYSSTVKGTSDHFKLEGMMKYVASLGCYVIGHKEIPNIDDHWTEIELRRTYFIDAVNEAKAKGVDASRLGIVGKSAGGMHAYALMKYFKEQNNGTSKSFIIDDIGYLAVDMKKADLEALNIDSLILHYGMDEKYTGVQTKWPQDPRVLLTIAHILKHDNNKVGFLPIATDNHSYEGGDYNTFKEKYDLMQPIDAMIKYELFNENGQYNSASNILFSGYEQTRNKVIQDTLDYLGGDESEAKSEEKYGSTKCKTKNQINYCQDYK